MSNLYEKFHNENVSTKEYDEGTDNNVTRERVRAVEEAHIIMCSAGDLFTAELPQPGTRQQHIGIVTAEVKTTCDTCEERQI